MRWPLEQHRDVAALERAFVPPARFDPAREVDDAAQLCGIEIGDVEEIPAQKTAHSRDHDPRASQVGT